MPTSEQFSDEITNQTIWRELDTEEVLTDDAEKPKSLRYNVVVIGGGYTGLSAALHLAKKKKDWRICVFEAHEIGWGASGRNGGLCEVSGTHFSPTLRTDANLSWWMNVKGKSVQLVIQLATEYGINIDKTHDGVVHLRTDGSDSEKIQTPPDLVVKSQRVDIVAVILWMVLRLGVV